jgi:hypothetical protein
MREAASTWQDAVCRKFLHSMQAPSCRAVTSSRTAAANAPASFS